MGLEGSGDVPKCDLRACARIFALSEQRERGREAWAAMVRGVARAELLSPRGGLLHIVRKLRSSAL